MSNFQELRDYYLKDEDALAKELLGTAALDADDRSQISQQATALVTKVRAEGEATLMEAFLAEYELTSQEGIALMCLAEALLRVPDTETIDDLIADKITASAWDAHPRNASSILVNASTWALMLTGKVLSEPEDRGMLASLKTLVRRLGEPVVRTAVAQAMREMGRQFVLGETIRDAVARGASWHGRGYRFSYDMLGEGARTDADARSYHLAYADALTEIAHQTGPDVRDNPGISVKLSALHARYEDRHAETTFDTLLARIRSLCVIAAGSNVGVNIDAEEADRLEFSLRLVDALLDEPALADWQGLGVVVQAYGKRAGPVLRWLYQAAEKRGRKIMVRLVKGAYWDTEIKRAQVLGLSGYPVFTRKATTDLAYIAHARTLLDMSSHIYPQFATHNAHTMTVVRYLAAAAGVTDFEFQRLHGMGESVHELVKQDAGTRCRIYAPVGVHKDLLAYLVRRLLENGANSSFVHQLLDEDVPPEQVAGDPLKVIDDVARLHNPSLRMPAELFAGRTNSKGWDLEAEAHREWFDNERLPHNRPLTTIEETTDDELEEMIAAATASAASWASQSVDERAKCLENAADLFEQSSGEIFALLAIEAHKTPDDALSELREAVDFLRYYAAQARHETHHHPAGVFSCISPWNFPLAIFTGQVAAALVTGNSVIAKPAEQTPRIAMLAVRLLREAGVPPTAVQLAIGPGRRVGARLTSDERIDGVCFTGSTNTALLINRSMAEHLSPAAPLIAETGGINTMIVDSTALAEQAVRDIVDSAFQSAGQRCSALRMLYLQEDVADRFVSMLKGAMDELRVGDPWHFATDVGPVIDASAQSQIQAYIDGRQVEHQAKVPDGLDGHFVTPTLLRVAGIDDIPHEVFGPVLHYATFKLRQLPKVLRQINARGFGLTFALHTRLDDRAQHIVEQMRVGNVYINRNQIGAVVGSQPFGGEGLSGTGPKAGGPNYLARFTCNSDAAEAGHAAPARLGQRRFRKLTKSLELPAWQVEDHIRLLAQLCPKVDGSWPTEEQELPGPTGERNILSLAPRGVAVCLGPSLSALNTQIACALRAGCVVIACTRELEALTETVAQLQSTGAPIALAEHRPTAKALLSEHIEVVAYAADDAIARSLRWDLSQRDGPIVRFSATPWDPLAYCVERHVCTDTTAAGGNARLLADAG